MGAYELNFAFFIFALALKIWEWVKPMRPLPHSAQWISRSAILTLLQLTVVYVGMEFLPEEDSSSLLRLRSLPFATESAVAILIISFISYWQHRLKHRIGFLWNFFHQVHHSPTRIELLTSFYRNPLEILLNMLFLYLILFKLLGFHRDILLSCTLFLGFADLFYHANIRTPYLLGFVVQRPESHLLHHMRGVHAFNYGDVALWDILFGTFRNLHSYPREFGFADAREEKLFSMIAGEADREKRVIHH